MRLTLDFDATGRHYRRPNAVYVEHLAGDEYEIEVAVTKDFAVEERYCNIAAVAILGPTPSGEQPREANP